MRRKRLSQTEALDGLAVFMQTIECVMQRYSVAADVVHEGLDGRPAEFSSLPKRDLVFPQQLQRDQRRRFLRNGITLSEPCSGYEVDWQFHVKRFHVFYRSAQFTGTSMSIIAQPFAPTVSQAVYGRWRWGWQLSADGRNEDVGGDSGILAEVQIERHHP
jgi:hypothetical protein